MGHVSAFIVLGRECYNTAEYRDVQCILITEALDATLTKETSSGVV
jgi:hypothetical protein